MKVLLKTLTWIGFFFKNQRNESAKICHFQYKMHTVRITWFGAFGHTSQPHQSSLVQSEIHHNKNLSF